MMSDGPVVVLKVGGSLLTIADLGRRLTGLLAERPQMRPVLVCGGGAVVDAVREEQSRHQLSDETTHWMSLRAMGVNELLVASLIITGAVVVHDTHHLQDAWSEHAARSCGAESLLQHAEADSALSLRSPLSAPRATLPHSWDVTSDSIAAWIALEIGASELVLLKSVDAPVGLSFTEAAAKGLIDRHFPRLDLSTLRVSWVNLRADRPVWTTWRRCAQPLDA